MQYFGGKQRIAKRIAEFINAHNPKVYLEPFCGSCNVGCLIQAEQRIFSDIHPQLIAMWENLMAGWEPPEQVSEEQYRVAQEGFLPDYLTGFIGFACSYSGKWFGGYARNSRGDNFARQGARSLTKKSKLLAGSEFVLCDYQQAILAVPEALIYCDPPYNGTTKYKGTPDFDSEVFWESCRRPNVFVSEYTAPSGFREVLTIETNCEIRGKSGRDKRVEKLFTI